MASGSGIGGGAAVRPAVCSPSHQLNAVAALSQRRVRVSKERRSAGNLENRFLRGTTPLLRNDVASCFGLDSLRLLTKEKRVSGRVMAKGGMSQVPEKPLGLYDPSFDKDSCGVGFVAELSGESSRKTVRFFGFLLLWLDRVKKGRIFLMGFDCLLFS